LTAQATVISICPPILRSSPSAHSQAIAGVRVPLSVAEIDSLVTRMSPIPPYPEVQGAFAGFDCFTLKVRKGGHHAADPAAR